MKVRLQAGAELDLLSPAEAREIVVEMLEQTRAQGREESIRAQEGGLTDAAGAALIPVYGVPLGREFVLTRLIVDADGYTPGVPFKNAVGYIDVLRSGERVDFVSLNNGIPALSIDSKESGNRWRNGEVVEVRIVGGPAATTVRAAIHGLLRTPGLDGASGRTRTLPGGAPA